MFIVVEGLDGSGKSTQLAMLKEYLKEKHIPFEYYHFPRTDSPFFGELIARFLRGEFGSNDNVDPYLVAILYAGDRRDAALNIRKSLAEGKHVIADRYVYSNIAYQCAKLDNPELQKDLKNWILNLEFRYFEIPHPDVNIFLDVPIDFIKNNLANQRNGEDRKYLNGAADIHEMDISFQEKVRSIYLWLASTEKDMKIIPCFNEKGMLPPDEIFQLLMQQIKF
jgi:dTMP kinase